MVAGGRDDNFYLPQDVWVLDDVSSTWGVAAVELDTARSFSAGLLLGDLLVCMGG